MWRLLQSNHQTVGVYFCISSRAIYMNYVWYFDSTLSGIVINILLAGVKRRRVATSRWQARALDAFNDAVRRATRHDGVT